MDLQCVVIIHLILCCAFVRLMTNEADGHNNSGFANPVIIISQIVCDAHCEWDANLSAGEFNLQLNSSSILKFVLKVKQQNVCNEIYWKNTNKNSD